MGWCICSMSNPYIGIDNSARLVKQISIGQSGVARKVLNGYIGVNGAARLFYRSAIPFSYTYTGDAIETEKTIDGVEYVVLTLTSSGTFTANRPIDADVWLCGGGGDGGDGTDLDLGASGQESHSGGGGGGGYITTSTMQLEGDMLCTIGAARGSSGFGIFSAASGITSSNQNGGGGASGGGGGIQMHSYNTRIYNAGRGGRGSGNSTIPTLFGLTDRHCAGGSGGLFHYDGFRHPGNGGSNGSDGEPGDITQENGRPDIYGGEKGGGMGRGSNHDQWNSQNGTFYGSAGGGGLCSYYSSEAYKTLGGSGYQGVVYIRWKKEDAE